ncbi:hypothetical protein N9313_00835 [Flavobacteriaceae bacterium]|nr:hypothetical protein [Flavobacteriaceae bacterium]
MKIILYSLIIILSSTSLFAQEALNQFLEKRLEDEKELIKRQERLELKKQIKQVNSDFLNEKINSSEADSLKLKYAEETAKRIEQRITVKENEYPIPVQDDGKKMTAEKKEFKSPQREIPYYMDSDIVLAFGLNNLFDPNDLETNENETIKSFFFEGGWSWKTNLIPYKNFLNIRYGFSLQENLYANEKGNIFFKDNDDQTIKRIPFEKSYSPDTQVKLFYTNLVLPIHLEFGSRRYRQLKSFQHGNKTITRYRPRAFIFGVGGYGGLNIFNAQSLNRVNGIGEIIQDINFNDFNYGISGYISFPLLLTLYGKIDTSPLFKNQSESLYNASLGIRFGIN